MALKDAAQRAKPFLTEPVMELEVVTPEQYLGDVIGDLNSHRAEILGINPRSDAQVITAKIPLIETFGYATRLRSLTQGGPFLPSSSVSTRKCPNRLPKRLSPKSAVRSANKEHHYPLLNGEDEKKMAKDKFERT